MTRRPSLPEVVDAIRDGSTSVAGHLADVLARIDAWEPEIRSLLPEDGRADRLREQADRLDRNATPTADLALRGSILGVKDIFRVDGFATHAGSRLPAELFAGPQADAVTTLLDDGALVLGKTVTTEFAYFAPGPTRNPHNPAHTPGGSSSGSAAAVAAGLCDLALGTQTIGSVIRPASFCGIVGFKPTFGRVSIDGVIPLAPSLDHVGWFASDVAGARLAAQRLLDEWNEPGSGPSPRLAMPAGPYLARAGDISRRFFDRAVATLSAAGITVQTVAAMTDFEEIVARNQQILAAEAAQVHGEWFRRYPERYHDRTSSLIQEGQKIDPSDLATARAGQARLRTQLQATMDRTRTDLWVAPSTLGPAPRGLESTGDPVMNLPWTQAGMPALTLPIGVDPDGLPLGLQIVGRAGDDERLLAWAGHLEGILQPTEALRVPALEAER